MALDNLEGIREYRDRLLDLSITDIVGITAASQASLITLLLDEIDRLQKIVDTGKETGSVKLVPLHKRRKVRGSQEAPDLV